VEGDGYMAIVSNCEGSGMTLKLMIIGLNKKGRADADPAFNIDY
jgi:hypothetical protein